MSRTFALLIFLAGCSGASTTSYADLAGVTTMDLATSSQANDQAVQVTKNLVINEVNPNGADPLTDPDWVEIKNVSSGPVSLKDYQLEDSSKIPAALVDASVMPGDYVIILCDDAPDMGGLAGIHVPFKLKGKGDEVHLLIGGAEVDMTSWGTTDVPDGKSWARVPDGTGAFMSATPTKLAANMP
jgi:hypothetical protein